VLRRMSAADRASLGKAGLTRADCEALCEAKNERELQKQIVSYLRLQGIEVNVSRTDKRTTHKKGWPDLTFAIIFRVNGYRSEWIPCAWEIKFGNGKLSPEQEKLATTLTSPPNGWRFRVIRSLDEARGELWKLGIGTGN
jgi:hypothetical protein